MEEAIYLCPAGWRELLPRGVRAPERAEFLPAWRWELLALTRAVLPMKETVRCRLQGSVRSSAASGRSGW